MTQVRVKFPENLTIGAGLFLLTLTTAAGSVNAQVYFLQGEDGAQGDKGDQGATGEKCDTGDPGESQLECADGTCTLVGGSNLVVNGQVSGNSLDCPFGYTRATSGEPAGVILCLKEMGASQFDEMVKVGDFWIDRYEVSMWPEADCTGDQFGTTVDDFEVDTSNFPGNGNWVEDIDDDFYQGIPAVPGRGGDWGSEERSGIFQYNLAVAGSSPSELAGIRCCVGQ